MCRTRRFMHFVAFDSNAVVLPMEDYPLDDITQPPRTETPMVATMHGGFVQDILPPTQVE